jgi:hypothetical protein
MLFIGIINFKPKFGKIPHPTPPPPPKKKTLRWTSNPPQENLTKFGSITLKKVEFFSNPTIYWQLAYCPNMAISTSSL